MSDNYHNYQLLLAKAAQLYERHGIGLPDPFNVFSSLKKLTGTDCRGKYMSDLKELCLEDNNFVLIHDLRDAIREVETELRKKMWDEIESELKSKIQYFPNKKRSYKKGNKGLCYQLSESTSLEVVGDSAIWFGVRCSKKKYKDKYDTLKNALEDVSGGKSDDDSPWWVRYVDIYLDLNNPEDFRLLSNDAARQAYTKKAAQEIIAKGLKELLEVLEDIALVNAIKEGEKTELVPEEQIFEILERVS